MAIWDTAFTQGFDEKMLSLLMDSDDVARDLRRLQLEDLAKWRVSTADHSNGRLVGGSDRQRNQGEDHPDSMVTRHKLVIHVLRRSLLVATTRGDPVASKIRCK